VTDAAAGGASLEQDRDQDRGQRHDAERVGGDLALRYATRFRCIGADCEDDCCHTWRVEVDPRTVERLRLAAPFASETARRKLDGALVTRPKTATDRGGTTLKMLPSGRCPLQRADGLCHIQAELGERNLPDVCAVYPRRIQRVTAVGDPPGGHLELTATVSCPEVARQLLGYDDACDEVPLDRGALPRVVPQTAVDLRDVRPYFRILDEARRAVIGALRAPGVPLEQRLFAMAWLAHRTAKLVDKDTPRGRLDELREQIALLADRRMLGALGRRFGDVEAPAALGLVIASELAQVAGRGTRVKVRQLVEKCLRTYTTIPVLLAGSTGDPKNQTALVWADYQRRRAAVRARAGARLDRYAQNLAIHYWMYHLSIEAPDLLVHTLRLLTLLAAQRFLVLGHPDVGAALQRCKEAEAAAHAGGEGGEQAGESAPVRAARDALGEALDRAMVEVVYTTSRQIEHSSLLSNLEEALRRRDMASLAGAVYLIRF